jgi:hypothetical protein
MNYILQKNSVPQFSVDGSGAGSGIGNEVKNNNLGHEINEKEETINDIYMLIIGYIIIVSFGSWFHIYFRNIMPNSVYYTSIIFVIIFPLILYSYYIFYQINDIREHKTYDEILSKARYEIEREEKIASIVPVILFGVGIVYSNIQSKTKTNVNLLQLSSPYLLFSLMFGTIIPNIISYLIFDNNNLKRVIVASDYDFISVSISFGLMIVSLLVPFMTHYNGYYKEHSK